MASRTTQEGGGRAAGLPGEPGAAQRAPGVSENPSSSLVLGCLRSTAPILDPSLPMRVFWAPGWVSSRRKGSTSSKDLRRAGLHCLNKVCHQTKCPLLLPLPRAAHGSSSPGAHIPASLSFSNVSSFLWSEVSQTGIPIRNSSIDFQQRDLGQVCSLSLSPFHHQ